MYAVESDSKKRLVVISAAGRVTAAEVEKAANDVADLMKDFAPGFRALADFSWLERMEPAAARHLARIMDSFAGAKVALVVRVMPDPHKDIGLNILSQFHYGPETGHVTVATLAEAIERLTADSSV